MALKLYTEEGWPDIESIYNSKMTFIWLIGSRQVGKSFSTLKYMIENEIKMVFMRRSSTELELALSGDKTAIFSKLATAIGCEFRFDKANNYIYNIVCIKEGREVDLGVATALTSLAHIRGFTGDEFEVIVFDEAIQETCVKKISGEGAAFINGYITINGNRELEGRPALRCIFLANANTLDSPILNEFRLTQKVEDMLKKNQEYSLMPERKTLVILPKSEKITGERAKMDLYLATGVDSQVARMALNNQFSYNDLSDVYRINLDAQWVCVFEIKGRYIWQSKIDYSYYVCSKKSGSPKKIWKMNSVGTKKYLIGHGHEKFILDVVMHKVVYSSYEDKVMIDESLYSTKRINI